MEMGHKCPYGGALDKPIKCQRTDGGNEFITHNNRQPKLKQGKSSAAGQTFFYNHNLQSVLYEMFYWQFFFFAAEECALANKSKTFTHSQLAL